MGESESSKKCSDMNDRTNTTLTEDVTSLTIKLEVIDNEDADENIQLEQDGLEEMVVIIKEENFSEETLPLESNLNDRMITETQVKQNLNKCSICKKSYSTKYYLEIHMKSIHAIESRKTYQCSICKNKTFSFESTFKLHMQTHPSYDAEVAEPEQEALPLESNLNDRMITETQVEQNLNKCSICEKSYSTKYYLEIHMKSIHAIESRKTFQCSICKNKTFSFESTFKLHMQRHPSTPTNYDAKVAEPERIRIKKKLKKRQVSYLKNKQQMKSMKQMKSAHSGEVHEYTRYKCRICRKRFTWNHDLQTHMTSAHPQVELIINTKCSICDSTFFDKRTLSAHMRSTHSEKSLKCSTCEETFSFRAHLDAHLKSAHPEEGVYKCRICEKTFSCHASLWNHMDRKHDENYYKCSKCEETFSFCYQLKSHVTSLHPEEILHKCGICDNKTFSSKYELDRHMSLKHSAIKDEEFHECRFCDVSFSLESDLNYHISSAHSSEVTKLHESGFSEAQAFSLEPDLNYYMSTGAYIQENLNNDNISEGLFLLESDLNHHEGHISEKEFSLESGLNDRNMSSTVYIEENLHKDNYISEEVFSYESNLNDPEHFEQNLHKCSICNETFPFKYDLIYHMNSVHAAEDEKLHNLCCSLCQESFLLESDLNDHVTSTHGEKCHKCGICEDETFSLISDLINHMQSTHSAHPLNCNLCDDEQTLFFQFEDMKSHLVKFHNLEPCSKMNFVQLKSDSSTHSSDNLREGVTAWKVTT